MTTSNATNEGKEPDEAELRVLRNLARGASFEDGFVVEENAMRAMWQCLLAGWVDRGRLTLEGRFALARHEVEACGRGVILLPPSSFFSRGGTS